MNKPTIDIYYSFLEKTYDYLIVELPKIIPGQLGEMHFKYAEEERQQIAKAFKDGDLSRLKNIVKSVVPDMIDDTYYLNYVKEFQKYFPNLLSGTKKQLKRVLRQK